jgi:ubiquinone/menaquinone biosynthesis C-methylase UbiE
MAHTPDAIAIVNTEQAAAWDGHEGDVWSEHADRYEAVVGGIWKVFLDEQPIIDGDHVLDIGCGTGKSTRDAARLTPAGRAVGMDLSARMLKCARHRSAAEGLTSIEFHQADAQVHPFATGAFDLAISSFGAMFFNDPVAAFANIGTGLRPGGRIALLAWRELARNPWLTLLREALALGRDLPEPPTGVPGPLTSQ